ncbi:chorion class B protein PC10-like [Epargyreus clarus]|uniref:chorion class B protein PC10-like n=1 Tax=Epargyreus clarus TaxID=520877 RepID=UPI003C2ADE5E
MSLKTVLILCAQVLLIQSISAQCIGAPWAAGPCGAPCGAWGAGPYADWALAPAASLAASNGPGVAVATASPLIPAGVSVLSENAYAGELCVGGALPFLGTVAIEGALPTAGAGAVAYGCGNGAVGITAEDIGAVGFGYGALGYGAGLAGPLGYAGLAGPLGIAGRGCGCGAYY